MMNYLKNRKNQFSLFNKILFFIVFSLFIFSCKKGDNIGEDIVNLPGEHLDCMFTDTVSFNSYSHIIDSIATKSSKYQMLGAISDPVFGSTAAGIYTQVKLSGNNINFGNNAVCDSIIFTIQRIGCYGSKTDNQQIKIYQLDESLSEDSTYFSNERLAVKLPELCNQTTNFNQSDSIIKLILPNSFGDEIISKSGQTELSDNDAFLQFIKGFYIVADEKTSGGGLAYTNITSNLSKMTLYYHNTTDTSFENFVITTDKRCVYYTSFDHFNYGSSSSNFQNQVLLKDSTLGNTEFYVQPTAGIRANINFPYLKNLIANNPIAIQKAELVINVSNISNTGTYPAPLSLALLGLDSLNNLKVLVDNLNMQYDNVNKQYTFIITQTIQDMLRNNSDIRGLQLIVSGEAVVANRVVLNGNKSISNNSKLRLFYTNVK